MMKKGGRFYLTGKFSPWMPTSFSTTRPEPTPKSTPPAWDHGQAPEARSCSCGTPAAAQIWLLTKLVPPSCGPTAPSLPRAQIPVGPDIPQFITLSMELGPPVPIFLQRTEMRTDRLHLSRMASFCLFIAADHFFFMPVRLSTRITTF